MNSKKNNQDEWIDCRPGEIGDLAHQLKSRRRAQTIKRDASLMVMFIAVVFAGYVVVDRRAPNDPDLAGITCREVQRQAAKFVSDQLDGETHEKIEQHLAHCPGCREYVEQLRLKQKRPAAGEFRRRTNRQLVVAVGSINRATGLKRSGLHR